MLGCIPVSAATYHLLGSRQDKAFFEAGGLVQPEKGWTLSQNLLINGDFSHGLEGWDADPKCFKVVDGSLELNDALSCSKYFPIAYNKYKAPPGSYTIKGEIRTLGIQAPQKVYGVRLDVFGAGTTELIKGTVPWTTVEAKNVSVPKGKSAGFRVETYAKPSGVAWFRNVGLYRHQPPPLSLFMLYPNYRGLMFSDQSQAALFDLRVRDPKARYVALDVDGRIAKEIPAHDRMRERIGLAGLPDGPHTVTAELLDSAHRAFFAQSPYRVVKLPAATRSKIKAWIDANNQAHFLDGKPHFVLGIYDTTGYSPSVSAWEPELASIARAPINMIINYFITNAPISSIDAYTQAMARYGMVFLPTVNNFYPNHPSWPKGLGRVLGASTSDDLISRYAAALASNPGVAGYYVQDEPSTSLQSETFHQYQLIRKNDPAGFTLGVLNVPAAFSQWRDTVDVLGVDPYPLWKSQGNDLAEVADWTSEAVTAVHGARPVWTVIQFYQATSGSAWPTRQQLYDMSWMAITAGAQGLFYWSYGAGALQWVKDWPWTPAHRYSANQLVRDPNGNIERVLDAGVSGPTQPAWPKNLGAVTIDGTVKWRTVALNRTMKDFLYGELVNVTKSIKMLEPVILSPDREILASNSAEGKVFTKQKNVDGVRYLFTFNHSAGGVPATFTLTAPASSASVADEGRSIPLSGQRFTDFFAPYQAHVYRIR